MPIVDEDDPLPLQTLIKDRYRAGSYDVLYSGASGLVMKAGHRMMERGVAPRQNARVLEIGGGGMPHFYWMNHSEMQSYIISDEIEVHKTQLAAFADNIPKQVQFDVHDFESDPLLATLSGNFTRVIASHVLEHIPNPERAIRKWSSLLSADGILSIALPCDPGWLWRLGQYVAFKNYKGDFSFNEYDLLMSREHLNSVQRILKILRYYYLNLKIFWFPFVIPITSFNLICVITVRKSDMRSPQRS